VGYVIPQLLNRKSSTKKSIKLALAFKSADSPTESLLAGERVIEVEISYLGIDRC
jgi:hypothetical protein